jgi:glycosyltransferase involved in cell wall biosynthesis
MDYILITTIKDESKNLSRLKDTIIKQTIKPLVWVIVDGGSTDGSFQIAKDLIKLYDWIYVIHQKKIIEKGYSYLNFSQAINEGYNFAKELCEKKKISYSFIGKTDATPILAKNYFEILITEMINDPKIAFTCGSQQFIYKNKKINITPHRKIPLTGFNDIRLYRKEFFEDVEGYPLAFSPDGILLIKAINRGWKIRTINNAIFIEPRLSGSKVGIWKGTISKGKVMYVLGYHPLLALMNSIEISLKIPPHYQALPMLLGYLLSAMRREEKINDKEVREYYGEKRLKEVIYTFLTSRSNIYEIY